MVGEFDNPKIRGIIPRSLHYIFKKINSLQKEEKNSKYNINIALIQIYLEMIQDLFEPNNHVKIREDPDKGVFLENCLWINVKNSEEFEEAFKKGEKNRITECTKMNAQSSRSHVILIVKIQKNFIDEESNEYMMTQGHLYLVDLAGSERVTKTNARELRLEEAKKINYSLLVLGNCIQSLISPNSKYISYRDSKLTRILQESLGGNAKTSLIVTISPSGYNSEETLSSLNFGLRAMKVQNKPVINKTEDYQALFYKLQEDYDKLLEEKTNLTIEYNKVCDENDKIKNDIQRNDNKEPNKNNSKSISYEEMENIKKKFEKEMKNLEKYYGDVLKNKDEENEKIMKDIDNILIKKDNEIQNLSNKLNEYKIKLKNVTDINYNIKKDIEDFKKTYNDILIEKEQLNSKINSLTVTNQNLTKDIDILNNKKDSLINKETQTDSIINNKIKELLKKYKVPNSDIVNNNLQKIIFQLLMNLERMNNDSNINSMKMKKLNDTIENIKKNYEEKIKKLNEENTELKNNILILEEEKKEINELSNDFKIQKENELLECKNKIEDLQVRVKQIDENKNHFEEIKKNLENEINDLKKDNKLLNMNNQSLDSELKRIQGSFGNNEKNLNRTLTQIYKDNNLFIQFRKQIKKLENIIDNDLIIINENNYEHSMNKAKIEGNKFKSMIEDASKNQIEVLNSENLNNKLVNNDKYLSNNNMPELINKINENFEENKNNSVIFLNLISKIYNKHLDLYKKYKDNSIEYEKNNILRNQKNLKKEENLKNYIISITKENIDKFSPMCFNNSAKDLKIELKNLSKNSQNMTSFDVLQVSLDILGKLLLRTSSFKNEKELEIENLNGKIIYLLSELDIYKKNANLNTDNTKNKNETQLLNNQLCLKEEEINRLNKNIEEYLLKIKELSCENDILRNNQKNKINSKINIEINDNCNKYPSNNYAKISYNKINYVNEINNEYNNKNKNNKFHDNKNNIYNNNDDSDKLSEKIIENDLAKNQDDIDKINAQLRELSQLENGNMNNYENKRK